MNVFLAACCIFHHESPEMQNEKKIFGVPLNTIGNKEYEKQKFFALKTIDKTNRSTMSSRRFSNRKSLFRYEIK